MKLVYKTYGTGDPVIIMHGLFGSGDNWRTIARMMESQYESIVVDMRNHGRSPHDPEMNFEVMTDDILELMSDLNLEKASLLGHSMGGKVAMQFALRYPEKVDKLIVVDIAPKHYPPHHDKVIEAIESIAPEKLTDRSEAEDAFARFLGNDQSTIQFLMKNLSRLPDGGFEWKPNMPVIIDAYYRLMEDVMPSEPFTGPALFVRGERSRYILDEDIPHIKELFPNSSLVTIPGAGHWIHADAPELFTKTILSFLSA
jgi:pimeloyl-ACP methyl ester carboxylesterase